ncbi:MAG TPA: energy transducer TonB, partial [Chthoniobacteraceae bacterium]|nr:energy transducer TonB [Chthoniobacteraceae bacterium]
TPRPTPRPTPRETPRPKPKPKPKPKTSPRPKSRASESPRKHTSPKPSPHHSPKPHHDTDDDSDDSATTAAQSAFRKATGRSAGNDADDGTAPGKGGGKRGGEGHAGGGDKEGDFGWYNSMLHDRFYSRWDQPTNIVSATTKYSTIVKIKIEKDGAISDVSLAQSSGNDQMDQSVMEAARRVTQVDPLPQGLGDDGSYEVKIEFELSQQSQ